VETAPLCTEFDEHLHLTHEDLEHSHNVTMEKIHHNLRVTCDDLKAKAHDAAIKLLPVPKSQKKGKHKATSPDSDDDEMMPTSSMAPSPIILLAQRADILPPTPPTA
jgi:hypothetical protein